MYAVVLVRIMSLQDWNRWFAVKREVTDSGSESRDEARYREFGGGIGSGVRCA